MFKIINTVYYFKNLSLDSLEEIFYSLDTDYYERDTILVDAGDSLDKIWILVDGEVDINVQMDTGEVIIMETLTRGWHFGQFSCLIEAPQMFQYKAKTNVMIQSINTVMLETLRIELADLDDELANGFIHEYGVPVCDFKVNDITNKSKNSDKYHMKMLTRRFKDWVRRAFVLNMYKKKKTTRLTQLIIDLKKKALEEEEEEHKERKRERYKKDLGQIVLELIKDHLPESQENKIEYIKKIFQYMELKKQNFVTILEDQNKRLTNFNKKILKMRDKIKKGEDVLDELLF